MWCSSVVFVALIIDVLGVKFLIVTHDGVRLYTVGGSYQEVAVLKDMVKDVDYHYARNQLYMITYRQILRTTLEGQPTHDYVPVTDPLDEYRLTSLAVDWVHNSLYWTSGAVFIVHRAFLNGSDEQVILRGCYIERHLNKIVVDPYVELLFWMTNNEVHSANLQGKDYRKNVFPEISSVRNIALDTSLQRIFFLAAFSGGDKWYVVSSGYDGSGLRRHAEAPQVTYGLGCQGGVAYWIPHEEDSCTWVGNDVYRHSFTLCKASTETPSPAQRLMMFSEPVWNLRVCHPDLQTPRLNHTR